MPNYIQAPNGRMVDLEKLSDGELRQLRNEMRYYQGLADKADPGMSDSLRSWAKKAENNAELLRGHSKDLAEIRDEGVSDAWWAHGFSVSKIVKPIADFSMNVMGELGGPQARGINEAYEKASGLAEAGSEAYNGNYTKAGVKAGETLLPHVVDKELKDPMKGSIGLHKAAYGELTAEKGSDHVKSAGEAIQAVGDATNNPLTKIAGSAIKTGAELHEGVQDFKESGQMIDDIRNTANRQIEKNEQKIDERMHESDRYREVAHAIDIGSRPGLAEDLEKINKLAPHLAEDDERLDEIILQGRKQIESVIEEKKRSGMPDGAVDDYKSGTEEYKPGPPPDSTELVRKPPGFDDPPTPTESIAKKDLPGPDFDDLPARDQQALNRLADEKFHEDHPELEGKPLGKDAPQELKDEWMRHREDAYEKSRENTATDDAYRKHYEELGITPPDKIDPNNPEHAEFQKTWNDLNDGITGEGAAGASAELQTALDQLIADTRAKLAALDDETGEELGKIEGLVTDISGIADKAEAAKNSAERSLAQAEEAVHG